MIHSAQLAREFGLTDKPSWAWRNPPKPKAPVSKHQEDINIHEQLRSIVASFDVPR